MVCRFESGSSPSTVRTGSRRPAANNFLRLKDRQLGLGGTERRHEMSLPVPFFLSSFVSFHVSLFHSFVFSFYTSLFYICISLFLHRPLLSSSSRLFLFLSLSLSSFSTRLMENPRWSFGGRKKGREKSFLLIPGRNGTAYSEESARKMRLFAWCVNVSSNERILLSFEEREFRGRRRRRRIGRFVRERFSSTRYTDKSSRLESRYLKKKFPSQFSPTRSRERERYRSIDRRIYAEQ